MTQTITRTYDRFDDARETVRGLKALGVQDDSISVIAHEEHHRSMNDDAEMSSNTATGAGTGASVGGLVGGGAGLLAGLGLMAIPGVGPLVAAGWLASTAFGAATGALAGAATGGLVGALTESGVDEREANTYAEAVRRGSILVSVRAPESDARRIADVMDRHSPADLGQRRSSWEAEGWTGYDASAKPYDRDQISTEQSRWR